MPPASSNTAAPADSPGDYPDNPVLTRIWRGHAVESQHRGSWVLVDTEGAVVDGAGAFDRPVFARSSPKSLQALPLIESGAADRFGFGPEELALAAASHDGEPLHTAVVERMLARAGLTVEHLKCGTHRPTSRVAARELVARGEEPSALHNNCSGKHAGFLALAVHLGEDPGRYLDPESRVQRAVRAAVEEMCGVEPGELEVAIDGCSAPTFRLPLRRLATGIARLTTPTNLAAERRAACERITAAAAAHPALVAGSNGRLCTDILRATNGRLFPKIGAEAAYVVGVVGANRGLALKVDDGAVRGMQALLIELLRRHGFLDDAQVAALGAWCADPLRNWAGLEVGRVEVVG